MIATATYDKLEKILSMDLHTAKSNSIFTTDSGYQVFGKYEITKKNNNVSVSRHDYHISDFSSVKTAVSWCIADKYNQYKLADEVLVLDHQRSRLHDDLFVTKHLLRKSKDCNFIETVELKLETKQHLLTSVELRLDKCASLAKYWQLRGFNNEIERIRRTASNKDNRSSIRGTSR